MAKPRWDVRRFDPRRSLAVRMTVYVVLVVAITLAGVTFATTRSVRTEMSARTGENFQAQAEGLGDVIGLFFRTHVGALETVATSPLIRDQLERRNASYPRNEEAARAGIALKDLSWPQAPDNDPLIRGVLDPASNETTADLRAFLTLFGEHTEVFVTDRFGAAVAATGRLSDYYQADEPWWQSAWQDGRGGIYISQPEFDESAGVNALLIAVPVYGDQGEVLGVMRSTLNVDAMLGLPAKVRFGETGHALLLDRDGNAIFDPQATQPDGELLGESLRRDLLSQQAGYVAASDPQGERWLFGYAPLRASGTENSAASKVDDAVASLGWSSVVRQREGEALSSVGLISRVNALAGGFGLIGLALVVGLIATNVTQPLTKLAAAARRVGRGDLDAPLPPETRDEVGQLSRSFGRMTEQLRTVISSLEERSHELLETNGELTRAKSELQRKSEQLERALEQERENARYDGLTHVYNHGAIAQLLDARIRRGASAGRFAVAMADVDRMKQVNDAWGHQAGDELLKVVAKTLRDRGAVVGRYGGDEFLALLEGADRAAVLDFQERVAAALASYELRDDASGTLIPLSVSIGFACSPDDAASANDLVKIADGAMYAMKRARFPRRVA